jgi:hypothetical protein
MSLTDFQIEELGRKMKFPLEQVCFKDELPHKIKYNKSYVINLEDEIGPDGKPNVGTHWCCFQVNKYPSGKIEPIYFDPYGMPPPEIVKKTIERTCGQKLPYCEKDIQSLMNNACGWYCCAFLHWINSGFAKSGDLYQDTGTFLELFDDLNKSVDFKKNEYVLKHFFQPKDPKLRKEIDVFTNPNEIVGGDTGGIDLTKV